MQRRHIEMQQVRFQIIIPLNEGKDSTETDNTHVNL